MYALVLLSPAVLENTKTLRIIFLLLTFISPFHYIHIHHQGLLDVATCTSSSMPSERVSFAPVGTAADGYTSTIVHSVCSSNNSSISSRGDARYDCVFNICL